MLLRLVPNFALAVALAFAGQWRHFGEDQSARQAPASPTDAMLRAHNALRGQYGVPALRWSTALAQRAERWARQLVSDNAFGHEQNLRYGQNLFEITGGRASPQQVVDAWASERKEYDARSGTCTGRCGHFTQIVWRTAEEVGCGSAHRGDREVWVCDYSPPGNIVGERPF